MAGKSKKKKIAVQSFSIRFEYKVREDFHSGNGMGIIGLYDEGQQSEIFKGRRIPVVRTDTFKGLLVDSCRTLMAKPLYKKLWMEKYKKIKICEIFKVLFEFKHGDSLFISSLRPTEKTLQNKKRLFRIITQTAIKDKKALDGSLRNYECGCAGMDISGKIRGRVTDKFYEPAIYFLTDGLKNLRRIGGKKNRGFQHLIK